MLPNQKNNLLQTPVSRSNNYSDNFIHTYSYYSPYLPSTPTFAFNNLYIQSPACNNPYNYSNSHSQINAYKRRLHQVRFLHTYLL